jgi:hypothetical protein
MADIESLILGSGKLTQIFGYWPSFHDALVLDIHFWRGEMDVNQGLYVFPVLTLKMQPSNDLLQGVSGRSLCIKAPADRRFRRIEIAMRIEPNDTAVPMVEAREYALAGIAASGQY